MRVVTISSKRQITLPSEMLFQLGIGPNAKLLIEEEKDSITLKPIKKSMVDELAGSLNKYVHPSKIGVSFETIMEEARKKVAKDLATKK